MLTLEHGLFLLTSSLPAVKTVLKLAEKRVISRKTENHTKEQPRNEPLSEIINVSELAEGSDGIILLTVVH